MSFSSLVLVKEKTVEILHENVSPPSTEDPPMEEWSSILLEIIPENPKITLYKKGLYDPGSGEICAQFIPVSDSDILRNVYFNYPAVADPGILEALQRPESPVKYPEDGQDLYLVVCEQMNVMPVRHFHRGLLKPTIDLKYYGINPNAMRSMTIALENNNIVTRLDFTSNYLNDDACYHIGELLKKNKTLQELVLSDCKIRSVGMMLVAANLYNRSMELLDLSSNDLRDEGFKHLANALSKGAVIKRLNLSNNKLTGESGKELAAAMEYRNRIITHLDLSWNNLFQPKGSNELLRILSMSTVLVELNMSWNALTTGAMLEELLAVQTLCVLDLSNNRLSEAAAISIAAKLYMAKKLKVLDLSNNPFTPQQAFLIMRRLQRKSVKLVNLIMENVCVTKDFVKKLEKIQKLPHRNNTSVVHGEVLRNYTLSMPDLKTIVLKRLYYLTAVASKKSALDIAGYFLKELKTRENLSTKNMLIAMKLAKVPVNEDLIEEVANAFPGPKSNTGDKSIKLKGVEEYIKRLWPDAKCPPTPPPEPEPIEPINKIDKKEVKGKKKR